VTQVSSWIESRHPPNCQAEPCLAARNRPLRPRRPEYEIDLSAAHGDEVRSAPAQYLAHAAKTAGTARIATRSTRGTIDNANFRNSAMSGSGAYAEL